MIVCQEKNSWLSCTANVSNANESSRIWTKHLWGTLLMFYSTAKTLANMLRHYVAVGMLLFNWVQPCSWWPIQYFYFSLFAAPAAGFTQRATIDPESGEIHVLSVSHFWTTIKSKFVCNIDKYGNFFFFLGFE